MPSREKALSVLLSSLCVTSLLTISGCTGTDYGGGVVYYTTFTAGYVPRSVAASYPLLVETYGSPTDGVSPASVNQATVEALRTAGPAWMPRNYTGDPAAVPDPPYHLRIAYAAPKTFKLDRLCRADIAADQFTVESDGEAARSTRTLASLCRGERAIAYGEGSPGTNPDIEGARFQSFVGLLGRQVMPRHNPVTEGDCPFRGCD